jgi:DNA end-binding protein Ku
MARRLVDGMSDKWKPEEFRDTYHEDLLALIDKRIQAGQTEAITEPAGREDERPAGGEVIDLMALLKRSVESKAQTRRPAAKAKPSRSDKHAGRKSA